MHLSHDMRIGYCHVEHVEDLYDNDKFQDHGVIIVSESVTVTSTSSDCEVDSTCTTVPSLTDWKDAIVISKLDDCDISYTEYELLDYEIERLADDKRHINCMRDNLSSKIRSFKQQPRVVKRIHKQQHRC